MSIALFSSKTIPLPEITTLVVREGITVSEFSSEWENSDIQISEETQKVVLIFENHGIAEVIDRIRRILGEKRKLILCCPHQSNANYELLSDLGVNEFITPKSWSSYHIAERILGQLIIEGEIETTRLGQLHGATRVMRELYAEIQTIANLSDPILILGETGTGKDLVAEEIHRLSNRNGKFIALNCSEFSPELVESELFGHSKGSFTGAGVERKGLLLESGSGTVFLDEIGELPMTLQSKLLRVIEDKKIRPVGANNWIEITSRFILATNRNIEKEIEEGNFRQDLFERIRGFTLRLPALREKLADILLLFNLFLNEYCEEYGKNIYISPNSLEPLFNYSWKGNVRELRALVRNLSAHSVLTEDKLYISPLRIVETISQRGANDDYGNSVIFDPATETLEEVLTRTEIAYLKILLELTDNNKEYAIKLSGISKSTFYEKIKRFNKDLD